MAFLNGKIEEEIYVELPRLFYSSEHLQGMVGKLNKALYGTKQAPQQWYKHLAEILEQIGFVENLSGA